MCFFGWIVTKDLLSARVFLCVFGGVGMSALGAIFFVCCLCLAFPARVFFLCVWGFVFLLFVNCIVNASINYFFCDCCFVVFLLLFLFVVF